MRQNLLSFLDDCERRGDETALAYRHRLRTRKWSYRRLRMASFQIAREFGERGIGKGDRILFWGENSAEWIAAFFACLLRGAIAVPLDIDSGEDFADRVQEQISARLLLTDPDRAASLATSLPRLLIRDLPEISSAHSIEPWDASDIDSRDIAEIIFTSGTTADPKGVCITHRNILANIAPIEREMQKYLRYERVVHPVRFLNLLPLSHVFGQFMGIFVPQLMGGEIFFLDSLNPGEIIEWVRRHRISVVVTVPRILEALRAKVERDWAASGEASRYRKLLASAVEMGALRRWWTFRNVHRQFGLKFWALISGGAALPAQTEAFWRHLGFAVIQGYGMTETAALVTVNHPFRMGRGSIGKTLPGQELRINEKGEILVRGENVSPGYWKGGFQPLAQENGWLNTGDVAELDSEGNLYFKSRSKDIIVTAAGMNIYPDDLEAALKTQPEVKDSAVLPIEGAQGPEPLAVLLLADETADVASVIGNANKLLNQYQQIRRWVVWPDADFPRTTTEKIRKMVVLERIRTEGLLQPLPAGGGSERFKAPELSSFLIQQIANITGETPATTAPTATLSSDLKLDSIGRAELLSAIEDHWHLDLDETVFTEATTLGEVERLIRGMPTTASATTKGHEPLEAEASQERARADGHRTAVASHVPIGSQLEVAFKTERVGKGGYPKWQRSWPIRLIRRVVLYVVILPLTRIMGRPRIIGSEKLDDFQGPVLVISNHVAMVDQALILLGLPARIRNHLAIAMEGERLWGWRHPGKAESLFNRVVGLCEYVLVVSLFNVFPLPQKSGFRRSFSFAGDCVDRGQSVLVFPEGRRTQTGEMGRFMDGIGLLATGLEVPVVPMRICGLYEMKASRKYFARRGQIRVLVGDPITPGLDDEPTGVARELERLVESLS